MPIKQVLVRGGWVVGVIEMEDVLRILARVGLRSPLQKSLDVIAGNTDLDEIFLHQFCVRHATMERMMRISVDADEDSQNQEPSRS